jgi:hypothetical protein
MNTLKTQRGFTISTVGLVTGLALLTSCRLVKEAGTHSLIDANQCVSARASVVGLSDTYMRIGGNGKVTGTVMLLGNSTLLLEGNAYVGDRINARSQSQITIAGQNVVGVFEQADHTAGESEALSFFQDLANLNSTQVSGGIDQTTTLQSSGGTNVIDVMGDINLSSKKKLTLSGGADDLFLIRVHGNVMIAGEAGVAVQGVTARNVMFLLSGEGSHVDISGQGEINGTFVAPRGTASISGKGIIRGSVLAHGMIDVVGNGLVFYGAPFCPGAWLPPVPEPTPEPTPSPTPTSSPTPEPTPSPTPTSSPTPEPTPSPTPSATPTPEPTPSPTPTSEPAVCEIGAPDCDLQGMIGT